MNLIGPTSKTVFDNYRVGKHPGDPDAQTIQVGRTVTINASKVKSSAKESSNPVEKAFLNALKEPKLESIENSVQAQAGHVLFHNAKIAHQMDNQNKKPSIELKSSS